MKKILTFIIVLLISLIVLALSVRGIHGNPNSREISTNTWKEFGPFELSPERGRFALLYSLIEDKSFHFSADVARFATPDVAIKDGKYVSLFAPLVSFTAIPGFLAGRILGASQVGAYATIAIFALINMALIRSIAIKLGANNLAGNIASVLFVFASPAFAYSVTLYQHHISTFLILCALYLALNYKNFMSLALILLLFAASIPVDYPNLVLMFPIALYASLRIIWINRSDNETKLNINFLNILSLVTVVIPLLFYVWFSQNSYGKPLQLSGTLKSVSAIDENGQPTDSKLIENKKPSEVIQKEEKGPEKKKTAAGFFKTRNLLNGLYLHFVSPDRGMLFFTPIMFFGFLGIISLWKKNQTALAIMVGIIGANILLYSMWGDPWGGWAFGSRYLIPTYSLLAILIAQALTHFRRNLLFIFLFIPFAIYSIGVNTLGALTSNTNPPQVEVLALEQQTKRQEKYTYERNWDYLTFNGSKSYAYNQFFKDILTPQEFYLLITVLISLILIGQMVPFVLIKK